MLDNAFAHLKSEIEPGKVQVALLELLHDAQRLQIMIEPAAERAHQLVELALPGMTERRMPDGVDECERFGEFGVQAERSGHSPGDLRDFEGMCEAVAKMIGEASGKNLGLGFQPAKRSRMNDAVAVARIFAAVRVCGLRVASAARILRPHRPRRHCRNFVDESLRPLAGTSGLWRDGAQTPVRLFGNPGIPQ